MAIARVTSEALQEAIRRLLPSQQGFGVDLAASNVITPIIDLTPTAEGSSLPDYLQTSLAFGSQTAFDATGSTVVVANTPGFYRIIGTAATRVGSPNFTQTASFTMSDGLSSKIVWGYEFATGSDASGIATYDFNVFLSSGESISAVSSHSETDVIGSVRQLADVNGVLTDPSGFTPQ